MAFPRPQYDNRSPPDSAHQKSRPAWESTFSASALRSQPPPHVRTSTSAQIQSDSMDPESSDSDVSVTLGDSYRFGSPCSVPAPLPIQPSKHALESSDAMNSRIRELSRVEDHNLKKHERLQAKRRRIDEKIARKREIQDRKIKAIMDARERKDARIATRRNRENAAFKKFDDEVEFEELNLRRRLKRLKRGLPLDESPPAGRSMSSVSMSPPGPSFSTVPPPAKRHQSGPPGKQELASPILSSRPQQSAPAGIPQSAPPAPQYSFYQSNSSTNHPSKNHSPYQPYSNYHNSPGLAAASNSAPPAASTTSTRTNNNERSPFGLNGRPASPLPRAAHSAPVQTPNPVNPSPRQTSSSYDTRPPPTSSGFASINAPSASGFAAINPRATDTPSTAHATPLQQPDADTKTPSNTRPGESVINEPRSYGYDGSPSNANITSTSASGKRTPSTTHPYQMSEAFANRHHHCERVDNLNRGIWTSYGPMGTQEAPTGPAVEMYLRCNHNGCRRIDWRTVHGLQCHIVKNHEQPKGTIGSLEKALDKYGVPVGEIEAHEREYGEGTAGTMADPKNLKIKTKTREASATRASSVGKSIPGSYNIDPMARPAGYKPSPAARTESPINMKSIIKSPNIDKHTGGFNHNDGVIPTKEAIFRPIPSAGMPNTPIQQNQKFGSVKPGLNSPGTYLQYPQATGTELSKLQGDAVMKDAAPLPSSSPPAPGMQASEFWKNWPAPTTTPTYARPGNVINKLEQSPKTPEVKTSSVLNQDSKGMSTSSSTTAAVSVNKPTLPLASPKTAQSTKATEPWPSLPRRVSISNSPRKLPGETVISSVNQPGTTDSVLPSTPRSRSGTGETSKPGQASAGAGVNASNLHGQESVNRAGTATTDNNLMNPKKTPMDGLVNGEIKAPLGTDNTTDGEKTAKTATSKPETAIQAPTEKSGTMTKPERAIETPVGPVKEAPVHPGPVSRRRSTIQSPNMTNKIIPTPNSAKRGSRRSSTVRKLSIDGVPPVNDNTTSSTTNIAKEPEINETIKDKDKEREDDRVEEEEGDTIVVSSNVGSKESLKEKERELARTPPKRNTAGRFTRRSKA